MGSDPRRINLLWVSGILFITAMAPGAAVAANSLSVCMFRALSLEDEQLTYERLTREVDIRQKNGPADSKLASARAAQARSAIRLLQGWLDAAEGTHPPTQVQIALRRPGANRYYNLLEVHPDAGVVKVEGFKELIPIDQVANPGRPVLHSIYETGSAKSSVLVPIPVEAMRADFSVGRANMHRSGGDRAVLALEEVKATGGVGATVEIALGTGGATTTVKGRIVDVQPAAGSIVVETLAEPVKRELITLSTINPGILKLDATGRPEAWFLRQADGKVQRIAAEGRPGLGNGMTLGGPNGAVLGGADAVPAGLEPHGVAPPSHPDAVVAESKPDPVVEERQPATASEPEPGTPVHLDERQTEFDTAFKAAIRGNAPIADSARFVSMELKGEPARRAGQVMRVGTEKGIPFVDVAYLRDDGILDVRRVSGRESHGLRVSESARTQLGFLQGGVAEKLVSIPDGQKRFDYVEALQALDSGKLRSSPHGSPYLKDPTMVRATKKVVLAALDRDADGRGSGCPRLFKTVDDMAYSNGLASAQSGWRGFVSKYARQLPTIELKKNFGIKSTKMEPYADAPANTIVQAFTDSTGAKKLFIPYEEEAARKAFVADRVAKLIGGSTGVPSGVLAIVDGQVGWVTDVPSGTRGTQGIFIYRYTGSGAQAVSGEVGPTTQATQFLLGQKMSPTDVVYVTGDGHKWRSATVPFYDQTLPPGLSMFQGTGPIPGDKMGATLPQAYPNTYLNGLQNVYPNSLTQQIGSFVSPAELEGILARKQVILEQASQASHF